MLEKIPQFCGPNCSNKSGSVEKPRKMGTDASSALHAAPPFSPPSQTPVHEPEFPRCPRVSRKWFSGIWSSRLAIYRQHVGIPRLSLRSSFRWNPGIDDALRILGRISGVEPREVMISSRSALVNFFHSLPSRIQVVFAGEPLRFPLNIL